MGIRNCTLGMPPFGCHEMEMKVNIVKTTQPDKKDITATDVKMEITDFHINAYEAFDKMHDMEDALMADHHKTLRFGPTGFSYVNDGIVIKYDIMFPDTYRPHKWKIDCAIEKKVHTELKSRLTDLLENSNENTPSLLEKIFSEYHESYKKNPIKREKFFKIYVGDDMRELLRNAKQKGTSVPIKGHLMLMFKDGKPALNISTYDDDDKGRTYIIKNRFYKDTVYELAKLLMKTLRN